MELELEEETRGALGEAVCEMSGRDPGTRSRTGVLCTLPGFMLDEDGFGTYMGVVQKNKSRQPRTELAFDHIRDRGALSCVS